MAEEHAERVFNAILAGAFGHNDLCELLTLINARGPTIDEVVGAARAMRRHALPVPRPATGPFADAKLLDTCGTGGAPKLFNVSTLGAIIAAAAGDGLIMICKHGNISRTGRGSAELLHALGVKVDAAPAVQTRCLHEVGLCFSLASAHHGATRHAAAARKALGVPTIFSLLGPLTNPGSAERQVVGTWSRSNTGLLASAAARLGAERALVFSSRDGLDELTTTDINFVTEVTALGTRSFEIDARDLGLDRARFSDLQASSLQAAVDIAQTVLAGGPGPCSDIAILNAAAALWIGDAAADLPHGLRLASDALHTGKVARTLARLVELSSQAI